MPGTLYIVSTPIGNLEDITQRALRILGEVDLIACEDTRVTIKLLTHYKIRKPLVSYAEHKWYHHPAQHKLKKLAYLLKELAQDKKIALTSNAGTPLISDPGYELVRTCLEGKIPVVPIPGPSAVITALSVAGLSANRFIFEGFLPPKGAKRRRRLNELRLYPCTIVFYESPHRFLKTLRDLKECLGNRQITIARELTKYYEEIRHGSIEEMLEYYTQGQVRGEFTLVVSNDSDSNPVQVTDSNR